VEVAATHAHLPPRIEKLGDNGDLRPGSPIRAVSNGNGARAGVAAFVSDPDGAIYLVMCGHAFPGGSGSVEVSGAKVADVVANTLGTHDVDAALCRLTPAGVGLAQSSPATTWLADVHTPLPSDNGGQVTFYPTNSNGPPPFVQNVSSYSANEQVANVSLAGLITLPECTQAGDSGSLLAFANRYYGLCSGTSGTLSCFTPIELALDTLGQEISKELRIWTPN
jgi:hypothetical protein